MMLETAVAIVGLIVVVACIHQAATIDPAIEIDEADVNEFIWTTKSVTTKYETEPRETGRTYYDTFRRLAESKDNRN